MLDLPDAPAAKTGPVTAWREPVIMQTNLPAAPYRNPLFLEKRVYQGSSGRVTLCRSSIESKQRRTSTRGIRCSWRTS